MRRIALTVVAWLLVLLACDIGSTQAFQGPITTTSLYPGCTSMVVLYETPPEGNKNNKEVPVGSKEYYDGFLTVTDEPRERVTGNAVLGPTLKFVGGISVGIMVLLLGFLASNELL